ncbi:MAG: DUF6702 family protein [Chitinophagales bacterium]
MKKITYILLVLLSGNLAFATHEFYVSICNIQHNADATTLEVTLKVFTDDFEQALFEEFSEKLQLGTLQENPKADELIVYYLQKYLQIIVNNDLKDSFTYIGKEVEINEMWCYLEIEGVENIETIEVNNMLLTNTFPKQSNIVNIRANARLESLMLNKDKTLDRIEY